MAEGSFRHLAVPVASEDDARTTARAVSTHAPATLRVTLVHVVEKAGGAPDKAGVEQREEAAEAAFDAFREAFDIDATVDTEIVYDTDVDDGILRAAQEVGADAVAFTPRGGSLVTRLLTGNVAQNLVDESEIPVLVLPEDET